MKRILIVSATLKNNYNLGKELKDTLEELGAHADLVSLENYTLPLYTDDLFEKEKEAYKDTIESLTNQFIGKEGLIVCGPEYNGSSHPILNNAIAWISCSTDYWRDAFSDKIALIGTASGGPGTKFITTMKIQLEHLGCVVMPRAISSNKSNPMDPDSIKKILNQFIKLL